MYIYIYMQHNCKIEFVLYNGHQNCLDKFRKFKMMGV